MADTKYSSSKHQLPKESAQVNAVVINETVKSSVRMSGGKAATSGSGDMSKPLDPSQLLGLNDGPGGTEADKRARDKVGFGVQAIRDLAKRKIEERRKKMLDKFAPELDRLRNRPQAQKSPVVDVENLPAYKMFKARFERTISLEEYNDQTLGPDWRKPQKLRVFGFANYTTIYLLGSGNSGKTSLINRVLDNTETPKPTLGLDYNFARRTVENKEDPSDPIKQVCNLWELGGDAAGYKELIDSPVVSNQALDKLAIFLVLDLSVPVKVWPSFEIAIKHLKRGVTDALAKYKKRNKPEISQKLDENIEKRLGPDYKDRGSIEPFPLPIVIIGTKFDLFQELEPEVRKQVSRILRLASHRLGASLFFYSNNDVVHNRLVKELFHHYAFGTAFPKDISLDYNKGLKIPPGADTLEQIGHGLSSSQLSFSYFKNMFETNVGKVDPKEDVPLAHKNLADTQNFGDPELDSQNNLLLDELAEVQKKKREMLESLEDLYLADS